MRVLVKTLMLEGLKVIEVDVEIAVVRSAIPVHNIVGLASKEVKESFERIRAAFESAGLKLPAGKITVNLSPADIVKRDTGFDLAIAVGLMIALGSVRREIIKDGFVVGEIGLDGEVKAPRGLVLFAKYALLQGKTLICRPIGLLELFKGLNIQPVYSINSLMDKTKVIEMPGSILEVSEKNNFNIDYVLLNEEEKLLVKLLAAWDVNALFIGPPGRGKSFIANLIAWLKAPLTYEKYLEVIGIYEYAGERRVSREVPVRSPHFTLSYSAMFGGGDGMQPGEVSLAHNGVLIMDEFPEFPRRIVEGLRQPLVEGKVLVSRASKKVEFPAKFQLLATMNPCPCGEFGYGFCSCSFREVRGYLNRVSRAVLDRIPVVYNVEGRGRKVVKVSDFKNEVEELAKIEVPASMEILKRKLNLKDLQFLYELFEKRGISLRKAVQYFRVIYMLRVLRTEDELIKSLFLEHFDYVDRLRLMMRKKGGKRIALLE